MELINKYIPISDNEITTISEEIKELYEKNLKKYKITLPAENTAKRYWLIYLYKNMGKAVHKDVISEFVREHIPTAGKDQQVRHLGAQDNYNCLNWKEEFNGELIPRGYSLLVNLTEPNPKFQKEEHKRELILNASNFEDIKKIFNYCCATCGKKEGTIHPRTNKKIYLQQGHINPSQALTIKNTIPQCEYCNQNIYKNDFIFDEDGYPKQIYNPNYILKSSEETQKEMLKILQKKFNII